MDETKLQRLRGILDKLPQRDCDFLREEFGVPGASGEIPVEHIKVCHWGAEDVRTLTPGRDMPEGQIRAILDSVQNNFDASSGMDWSLFTTIVEENLTF